MLVRFHFLIENSKNVIEMTEFKLRMTLEREIDILLLRIRLLLLQSFSYKKSEELVIFIKIRIQKISNFKRRSVRHV